MKKLISVFLAVMMALSLSIVPAYAVDYLTVELAVDESGIIFGWGWGGRVPNLSLRDPHWGGEMLSSEAFRNDNVIENVGGSLSYYGSNVFRGCPNLKTVQFGSIGYIADGAFCDCPELERVTFVTDEVAQEAESWANSNGLEGTLISSQAFQNCPKLTVYGPGGGALERMIKEIGVPFVSTYESFTFDVVYDSNGGSFSDTTENTKTVMISPGSRYPTPYVTRPNYTLAGWYTERSGGTRITQTDIFEEDSPRTFYAHWEDNRQGSLIKDVTVRFNGNGGSAEYFQKSVRYGEAYGALPWAKRDGYTFDGWYTAQTGGALVTSSTLLTSQDEHTLYAHWKEDGQTPAPVDNTFTLTFNANGGSVSPTSKTVTNGQAYGTFPTPQKGKAEFEGWYTTPGGGTQVKETDIVNLSANQTLYAHWPQDYTVDKLSYNFSNSRSDYGYPSNYRIPYERYALMFGDNALSKSYYNSSGTWGGNCFGMSSTASMFYQENNNVNTTSFRANALVPNALRTSDRNNDWNLTVAGFIEAMQISQRSSVIQNDYSKNQGKIEALCQAVQNFQDTGKDPVVIAVWSACCGHAIVGYDVVDASPTERHILVYDCNYPNNTNRYITLNRDSSGNYTSWNYDGYSSRIAYVPYSDFYKVWTGRAGATDSTMNLLMVSADAATIQDANGSVVAEIKNGDIISKRNDVYPVIEIGDTADEGRMESDVMSLWLPAGLYTVTDMTSAGEDVEATMVNVDQSTTVTTSSDTVTFAVNDAQAVNYVQVEESGSEYTISMTSTLDEGYADVQVSGKVSQDSVSVAQVSGSLYADNLSSAELKVDGAAASESILSGAVPDIKSLIQSQNSKLPFTDVKDGDWFYDAVQYVYSKGIMAGTGAATFAPNATTTRAQIVTMLYRMDGSPAAGNSSFSDVASDSWYGSAVAWAASHDIVNGKSADRFAPNEKITRQDFATILYRYAQYKGMDVTDAADMTPYADADAVSSYARPGMQWAIAKGLINGVSGSQLSPRGNSTRAQAATLLMRFDQLR